MSKNKRNRSQSSDDLINLGLNASVSRSDIPTSIEGDENSSSFAKGSLKDKMLLALRGRWGVLGLIAVLSLSALGTGLKYLQQDAARQLAARQQATYLKPAQESTLSRLNPFLPSPTPTPTPKLSKSYIYAGQRLLAVEDANAGPAIPSDLAVWRPSIGYWFVMGTNNTIAASAGLGTGGSGRTPISDVPVPGDYDGDGKTDFAVYRPGRTSEPGAAWYIIKSSDPSGAYIMQGWGTTGDIAVPADYDGDHRTDIAVYRPSAGTWYILRSSDSALQIIYYGNATDIPAPADYDGDGRADAAVFRQSNSTYYMVRSSDGGTAGVQLSTTISNNGQKPVVGDYDGDGKADYAMRNGADWIIQSSATGGIQTVSWYSAADVPVQNDYDGDGKCDVAVWHGGTTGGGENEGYWYIKQSSHLGQSNELRTEGWGTTGDIPVPALWRR